MSWLRLGEIAAMVNGRLCGEDARVDAVYTDSRKPEPAALFIALKGPRFDAHEFVGDGLAAAGAMVSRPCKTRLPQVLVEDTKAALGRLAANWRAGLNLPLVALTGSNGKTTVKEMLAAILATRGSVVATKGNLNNDIGVPLTLLRLRSEHDYAVVEMGANHFGEIAYLTSIARPTVAFVNNAGPAHLEGFGSVEGVSRAKGEIYAGLREDGVAIVNADDPYAGYWRSLIGSKRLLTFGLTAPADVSAEPVDAGAWRFVTPSGSVTVRLPLTGRHNVMNALAAIAACIAVGTTPAQIKQGLESMSEVGGRMQHREGVGGVQVLDDTYNANPGSLGAALEVLAAASGERWLVLGDMGELGPAGPELHRAAGAEARSVGIDRLYALGPLSLYAAQEFGSGAQHFEQVDTLCEALLADVHPGLTVLVKGSRSMRMERVVRRLTEESGRGPEGEKDHAA